MTQPMTPAVPDPTVEALSTVADEMLRIAADTLHASYIEDEEARDRALRRLAQRGHDLSIAARAAAPDTLRDRLQALCDAAMRNKWHLGAEAVSVTVAQVLAVVGEDE